MTNPIQMLQTRMKGKSLRAFAKEIPCSAPYLSDVLRGRREPGPKILDFLGLQRKVRVRYGKKQTEPVP